MLTRILWLEGAEEHNANTRERYIYIHGTNHEGHLGQPASHGCVRMRNADVAELYELIPAGARSASRGLTIWPGPAYGRVRKWP